MKVEAIQLEKYADTEVIAEDLQTCIDTFVGSAGTVESITFSGTGASGFTNLQEVMLVGVLAIHLLLVKSQHRWCC